MSGGREEKTETQPACKICRNEEYMKKQNKGVPTNRDIRWDRLDNTAHLFPVIAGESMSNVYRISVTLKEEINPELLQRALDMVLPKFDGFNLRLRQGVFWYYFEENDRIPQVKRENTYPCRFIDPHGNHAGIFSRTKTAVICSV